MPGSERDRSGRSGSTAGINGKARGTPRRQEDSVEIKLEHIEPKDIERHSMALIQQELDRRHIRLDAVEAPIVKRCIHTSADFDYAENLVFSANAVDRMRTSLRAGAIGSSSADASMGAQTLRKGAAGSSSENASTETRAHGAGVTGASTEARSPRAGAIVVTDTEMARAGISKKALAALGAETRCFMSDPDVAAEARARGVTRAVVSMEYAARIKDRPLIFAIGNAPTALIELYRLIHDRGLRPAGIIGVPVGFVNVVEAKELILSLAEETAPIGDIPWIVARGRKGGSNIAACIVNALLYGIDDVKR